MAPHLYDTPWPYFQHFTPGCQEKYFLFVCLFCKTLFIYLHGFPHKHRNKIFCHPPLYKRKLDQVNFRKGLWDCYWRLREKGPLQQAIYVVQNLHAGEQKSHWDKTNEWNYHLKLCVPFVCLVPVRLLLTSMVVLCQVNCWLQRTYWPIADRRVLNNYPRNNCGTSFGSSSLRAFIK